VHCGVDRRAGEIAVLKIAGDERLDPQLRPHDDRLDVQGLGLKNPFFLGDDERKRDETAGRIGDAHALQRLPVKDLSAAEEDQNKQS